MSYSDLFETGLKMKKKKVNVSKKDYTTPKPENKQNEPKNIKNLIQNVTNMTPIKRGDYKDWAENWKISDNPILEELDKLNVEIWINEKGEFVLRDADTGKNKNITPANINRKISSLLGKKVFIGSWKESNNTVTPAELISIISTDYKPELKKRFFYIQKGNNKKWYLNAFTPSEYMNCIEKPSKEPKTILTLIMHLVNYKKDRYYYFLNWLAYYWTIFKKPQTAIVLKGVQGAGKGILANEVIIPLFGKNQVSIITNDILESKFKANKFINKSFYIFEETSKGNVKSNKDVKEFIKQIITNEVVPMEEKRVTAYDVKVTAPSLFFTNEVKFLEIEPSDRRFSVFTTGGKIEETDFLGYGTFEALQAQIKKELPDFARYLYNYTVDVKLANKALNTPEKRTVVNITNNSFMKFLNAIKSRDLDYFDTLLDSEETDDKILFNQVETAFKDKRIKRALITKLFNAMYQKNITSQKLLDELKAIDPEFFGKDNITTNKGIRYILLP